MFNVTPGVGTGKVAPIAIKVLTRWISSLPHLTRNSNSLEYPEEKGGDYHAATHYPGRLRLIAIMHREEHRILRKG